MGGSRNINTKFPELQMSVGVFFEEKEQDYLFPLLVSWIGSDQLAAAWFFSEKIPAFGGKTGLEICKTGQSKNIINYIKHMEIGGFA
jgi:hypothetical protein